MSGGSTNQNQIMHITPEEAKIEIHRYKSTLPLHEESINNYDSYIIKTSTQSRQIG